MCDGEREMGAVIRRLKEELHMWWAVLQSNKFDCLHGERI